MLQAHMRLFCAWLRVHVRATAARRAPKSSQYTACWNSSGRADLFLDRASSNRMLVTVMKLVAAWTAMHSREFADIGSITCLHSAICAWSTLWQKPMSST